MREIVFDTETTGHDPNAGHRIVEIGCVEIYNYRPTGKSFQTYLNPEREVPDDAARVHGLTSDFLRDKPLFAEKAEEFLAFIGDAPLVIHNAGFDIKFINSELTRLGFAVLPMHRARDTLQLARSKFPGQPASLDALCRRFGVDNAGRTVHGALLDSELLAEVYFHLMGGAQPELFDVAVRPPAEAAFEEGRKIVRERRRFALSEEEAAAHQAFIETMGDKSIWKKTGTKN